MKVRARLLLRFTSVAQAERLARTVSLDDEGYIRTRRRGPLVEARATAEGPMSLLHTLDDYLACVSVAERTTEVARPPARRRRRPS